MDWGQLLATLVGATAAATGGVLAYRYQASHQLAAALRADRARAYEEAFDVLFELKTWCDMTFPVFEEVGHINPELPSIERQRRAYVLIGCGTRLRCRPGQARNARAGGRFGPGVLSDPCWAACPGDAVAELLDAGAQVGSRPSQSR